MNKPLVLSIDIGTQSIRAMLFDKEGNLLHKARVAFNPYYSLKFGYAEQKPELYWEKLLEAVNVVRQESGEKWKDVIGIAPTTMRDVCILLDGEMKPLRDAILWMDRREAEVPNMPGKTKALFKMVGMYETVKKTASGIRANWIADNEPEIWEKAKKFVMLSAYINLKLTGKLVDSVASTIGHIPFDYKNKTWFKENNLQRPMFKMSLDMLYDLVNPAEKLGGLSKEVGDAMGLPEGLPVIATGSDKGTETLGTGCVSENIASLSFGTTATVQMTTQKYVEPIAFLPAYPAVYPHRYNPEIQIYRGYWMISWFIEQFGYSEKAEAKNAGITAEKYMDRYINDIPAGCEGLLVSPYWGAGLRHPEDRGAIVGFTESHTRGHVYKAMIEGINFALMEGTKSLEKKTGVKVEKVAVSGGGTSSCEVCQLTADMFGVPVVRVQTYETSGLGAAICGFVGLGEFKDFDEAIGSMVHHQEPFIPDLDKHNLYQRLFEERYVKVPKRLRPIFRDKNKEFDGLKRKIK
ncbi:MAG: Glycerol kinase [Firmicutes bacterium ADurb.Bin080]|nr:MAG: Glycerol kinase [Firmicutes bacterium ADurb.Bin080]